MANKVGDRFVCSECGLDYPDPLKADACRNSHNMVYLALTRTELNRLVNAVFLQDLSVLPESVFEKLRKLQRAQVSKE
jgi:hypothetical protein